MSLLKHKWLGSHGKKFIYLFYFIFKPETLLVLPNIKTNPPQVYMCGKKFQSIFTTKEMFIDNK